MFSYLHDFDRMYERDGQTDRQTPHDDVGRACIAWRGKHKINMRGAFISPTSKPPPIA